MRRRFAVSLIIEFVLVFFSISIGIGESASAYTYTVSVPITIKGPNVKGSGHGYTWNGCLEIQLFDGSGKALIPSKVPVMLSATWVRNPVNGVNYHYFTWNANPIFTVQVPDYATVTVKETRMTLTIRDSWTGEVLYSWQDFYVRRYTGTAKPGWFSRKLIIPISMYSP